MRLLPRFTRIAWLVVLLAHPVEGQEATLTLGATLSRDIAPGDVHVYTVRATAGDLVAGVLDLHGMAGTFEVRDAANATLWTGEPSPQERVGFVAPASGTYSLRVSITGKVRGAYTLRMNSASVSTRLQNVQVKVREDYQSDRLRQLAQEIKLGRSDAVEAFWRSVAGHGPLVESLQDGDQDMRVTFLWREIYDTRNVLVVWPAAWYRATDYYMSHMPGTDIWYKTIRIRRGSRFSYWLAPNNRPADTRLTSQRDPLNPLRYPDGPDARGSVLETPGAPDETWVRRIPATRGVVERKSFKSASLKGERDFWVYTPPGYAMGTGPYPLVILFDGAWYVDSTKIDALRTLDNLNNDGRIRPAIVCFFSQDRPGDNVFRGSFAEVIATELLPMLRSSYAISKAPADIVIGGLSAGGVAASFIALKHPDLFGNVLSQSGAFRGRGASPLSPEPNALAQMVRDGKLVPVRFYLEYGLYETIPSAALPLDEMVLDETNTAGNRHFRDVLMAKGNDVTYRETGGAHEELHWRAMLADGLMVLLRQVKPK